MPSHRINPSPEHRYCVILSVLDLIHNQESCHQPIVLPTWQFSLRTLLVIRFQFMALVIRFQFMAIRSRHDKHRPHTLNVIHCDKICRKLEYRSI